MSTLFLFRRVLSLLVAAVMLTVTTTGPASSNSNGTDTYQHLHPYQHLPLTDSEAAFLALSEDPRSSTQRRRGLVRSARNQREPRFISFHTKDNNIQVEIQFAIPFITIPVKKSIDGMVSSFQQGSALLNINLGAIALAGVLTIGGAFIGGLARVLTGNSFENAWKPSGLGRSDSKDPPKTERAEGESTLRTILETVDKSLQKYDIDSTACTQRVICWYVKESMNNVQEQRASHLDTLVNGLSSADWAMKFTAGTAIDDAIRAGRRNVNCEQAFPICRIGPELVQRFISKAGRSSRTNL
ncbi:uncharacterized protein LOC128734808 [Sabethes cyaneus]|uniref:uncharacterized protein LOC128734808 n=1 Tax=Sabethes cyaneus TaxID=53552 RepID=UPI00237E8270|nr:uncharacterized protein LOC128734808 [Sabethes cyaneus]